MKQKKVIALVLAKNEEATIDAVINGVKNWGENFSTVELVVAVVDDSEDKTPEIAKSMGAVIIKGQGCGLGHSYAIGLSWAVNERADFIFTVDGDGQTALSEMDKFWNAMQENSADLVLGSRFLGADHIKYKYPLGNRVGVFLLSQYISITSGVKITDSHGGLRLYSKEAASSVKLTGTHTYVQESILSIVLSGLKVIEIESIWNERVSGNSRVVHSRSRYIKKMAIPLVRTGTKAIWNRLTK